MGQSVSLDASEGRTVGLLNKPPTCFGLCTNEIILSNKVKVDGIELGWIQQQLLGNWWRSCKSMFDRKVRQQRE